MARLKNSRWLKWFSACCAWLDRPRLMPRTRSPSQSPTHRRPGATVWAPQRECERPRFKSNGHPSSQFEVGIFRMITFLHGKLVEMLPTQVTVDVHGVGYEVLIPLSSFDKLPQPGHDVKLLTHLAIREDAHVLYGFMTTAERELFRLLINTVSGIGPKIALNVLSGMSVTALRGAVSNGDVKSLSQISGVGKKTAERIVVELKDKIGASGAWEAMSAQRTLTPADQKINDAV